MSNTWFGKKGNMKIEAPKAMGAMDRGRGEDDYDDFSPPPKVSKADRPKRVFGAKKKGKKTDDDNEL